jgi:putative addiction module component (TIGR02574 family)
MIAERIPEIANLTSEEKLLLANELWADVEQRQEDIPFNLAVVQLLDQRSEEFKKDPQSAVTWEEFKRRIGKA